MWLSLVERCVRDAEVASSNLVASIAKRQRKSKYGLLVKGLRRRPLTAKTGVRFSYKLLHRGVAQFGRALRSGRRGRKFKSCHLDHISFKPHFYAVYFLPYTIFTRFITKKSPDRAL